MTKQEFLSYASGQPRFKNECPPDPLTADAVTHHLQKIIGRNSGSAVDFLYSGGFKGVLYFHRREKMSGDILHINIYYRWKTHWREDIGQFVSEVTTIHNCTGLIEEFYISEDGRFWNDNNELKAENEEDFFEFLANVEYDFHPVINPRTYDVLRHFGWCESRHIDVTEFEKAMNSYGIILTEQQLAFFGEFSGLNMWFDPSDHDFYFYTLDEVLETRNLYHINSLRDGSILPGETLIQVGISEDAEIFLSSDGRIFNINDMPKGRNTIESINTLINQIPENYKYYDLNQES